MIAASRLLFSRLSRPQQRLVRLAQSVNFGRIVLTIRSGVPDAARPIRIVRTLKTAGGDGGVRPESGCGDFELRKEVSVLLDCVAHAPDGAVVTVKVEHGLPVLIEIEESLTA